jgi:hypothetical protein
MTRDRFKDQEHLLRLVAIFGAGLLLFLALQAWFVPKDFGLYGHYRPGALDDSRARPMAFAGRAACEACHTDVAEAKTGGKHKRIGCEACHGPLARHAAGEDAAGKPPRPTAALCSVCHTTNVGKPEGFPQVEPKEHSEAGACLECHKAHNPGV